MTFHPHLAALFCLASLLPTPNAVAQNDTLDDPSVFGPYHVGVVEVTVKARHHGREDLKGLLWYPAEAVDGASPFVYYNDEDTIGDLIYTAVEGAPIAIETAAPSMVFSHGNGGLSYQSVFFTEHLASHGFVVISVDHPGNTMFAYDPETLVTGVITRPLDVSAQLDYLERINVQADSDFRGLIDVASMGIAGHSYGGYTTAVSSGALLGFSSFTKACLEDDDVFSCRVVAEVEKWGMDPEAQMDLSDPRLSASIPMAPWLRPVIENGLSGIDIPMQVQGGDLDDTCPSETQAKVIFEGAESNSDFLRFFDAGHYAWSDICLLDPEFEDCSAPFIDMAWVHSIINTYATAHLKVHLAHDSRYEAFLSPEFANQYSDTFTFERR